MTLAKRVGQLFVAGVGSTSPTRAELTFVRRAHLGGVILMGHSDRGVSATSTVTHRLKMQATARSTNGVKLWVSVDQEGGNVQVLSGAGFSDMPTALAQGRLSRPALRSNAYRWGQQLRAAGVNLNLAPVMDTVPKRLSTANIPIGYYDREYGHRPRRVAGHGMAMSNGMEAAGVQTTAKHFPGLGRVRRNTDTDAGVTDTVTTRHDPYLWPFRAAIDHQVPVVMVSLARYTKIDRRHVATFSPVVMRMLRSDLGFAGVIMSDSLTAVAVQSVPVGMRAVRFLQAGGTVALAVTTPASAAMARAVLARAQSHRHFHGVVNRAALKVLQVKGRNGLLPC
jgi:beta-N-acetylhexosaminidase